MPTLPRSGPSSAWSASHSCYTHSSFAAVATLPLSVPAAFIVMSWQGITANNMSQDDIAIAIGAMFG